MRVTFTNPPKACDVCDTPFNNAPINDAFVPQYHRWGYLCDNCGKGQSIKYGVGLGQRFERDEHGVYVKTQG